MKKQDFYYELPKELIAQCPLANRADSRLMVVNRKTKEVCHRQFRDIITYLREGDCLVLNDTKVIPARLLGVKEDTGAGVEILLLKRLEEDVWEVIGKPGKKLRKGVRLSFGEGLLRGEVVEITKEGNRLIEFSYEGIFEEILDQLGEMPLPPYITQKLKDRNRYQTVYATHCGSAAAPTAGLHFTPEILQEIEEKGVTVARITLHVGLGTFRPMKEEDVFKHHMHAEYYQIDQKAADQINETKAQGGRVIAVGTTSCRTLETAGKQGGLLLPQKGFTDIFIYPGYQFQVIDALLTNFHLPESTLLLLVSAFVGREKILEAYRQAIEERYRFFSFGDAMLLL